LSPPRRSRAQRRSPDELDGHAVAPAAQRTRVVLIEDNPADVYLIQRELDRQGPGLEFVHYWDGDEALRHLLPGSGGTFVAPDLIFLDLRLPGIAGHEVLQILRGEPRMQGVRIVIISGAHPAQLSPADLAGSNQFIHKSMDLDDYLQNIRDAVASVARDGRQSPRRARAQDDAAQDTSR